LQPSGGKWSERKNWTVKNGGGRVGRGVSVEKAVVDVAKRNKGKTARGGNVCIFQNHKRENAEPNVKGREWRGGGNVGGDLGSQCLLEKPAQKTGDVGRSGKTGKRVQNGVLPNHLGREKRGGIKRVKICPGEDRMGGEKTMSNTGYL